MKKLDVYIWKQIAVPAAFSIVVISFLAVATRLREHYDDMPIELLSLGDVSRLSLYFLPPLAVFILPVTYLIGIIWALGQLTQTDELTAMKAGGVSAKRVSAPIVAGGILLSVCCFWMQNFVQPWGITKAYELIYLELPQRMTLDNLPTGEMHDYEDWRVYFRDKVKAESTLIDIDIIKPDVEGSTLIHAASARLSRLEGRFELFLVDGYTVMENGIYSRFDAMTLSLPAPSTKRASSDSRYALSIPSLLRWAGELREEYAATGEEYPRNRLIKVQREIAERMSAPFAALVLAWCAAPLSAHTRRKGRAVGFAHGAVIMLAYYLMTNMAETRSLEPLAQVVVIAWVPNALMFVAGAVVLFRADKI